VLLFHFLHQCLLDIGVTRVVSVQEVVPFLQDLCGKGSNQCLGNRVREVGEQMGRSTKMDGRDLICWFGWGGGAPNSGYNFM